MTDPKATNPIVEQGLFLSAEEYEVVSTGLFALAEQAEKKKNAKIYTILQAVLIRMDNAQRQGDGLTPESLARFDKRISSAYESRDASTLTRAVQDLVAATFRADADAASKVAAYLLKLVEGIAAGKAEAIKSLSVQLLRDFAAKLEEASDDWKKEGWPPAPDVLAWVVETLTGAAANMAEGYEPFPREDA